MFSLFLFTVLCRNNRLGKLIIDTKHCSLPNAQEIAALLGFRLKNLNSTPRKVLKSKEELQYNIHTQAAFNKTKLSSCLLQTSPHAENQ